LTFSEESNVINLRIANLLLTIEGLSLGKNVSLSLPAVHQKFVKHSEESYSPVPDKQISLKVMNKSIPPDLLLAECLCETEIFKIYQNESGHLTFFCPRHQPPCAISVDQDFASGQEFGEFQQLKESAFYPLQYIDIVFFSNWLASFGDLILHASGVAIDGKGYCFLGDSGVGKSTLADLLTAEKGVTLLGEDQVILRNHHGEFWIYGTPWHERPERCSPLGVPVEQMFFLKKKFKSNVSDISAFDGYTRLMQTAFIPYYRPEATKRIMDTLNVLSEQVQFQELSFELGSNVLDLIS
jgi:hypothetical protein